MSILFQRQSRRKRQTSSNPTNHNKNKNKNIKNVIQQRRQGENTTKSPILRRIDTYISAAILLFVCMSSILFVKTTTTTRIRISNITSRTIVAPFSNLRTLSFSSSFATNSRRTLVVPSSISRKHPNQYLQLGGQSSFVVHAFSLNSYSTHRSKSKQVQYNNNNKNNNLFSMTQSIHTQSSASSPRQQPQSQSQQKAKIISTTPQSLQLAGQRLRSGHLVSFPTETVYGLGCHALDPTAVQKVFAAKERPLTDPLIVHITKTQDALALWSSPTRPETLLLHELTRAFWPGPLTIVARATSSVPSVIMAGTGYVACRSPSHPVAREVIGWAGVPIAAPSANKFGHVSPTRAGHVMDDLGGEDVWIVDPGEEEGGGGVVCDVGVESTVVKVEMFDDGDDGGRIVMLRHGAVSKKDLVECLEGELGEWFSVVTKEQATEEGVRNVAPGQTVRHYSPNVLSYMVSKVRYNSATGGGGVVEWSEEERERLSSSVIIDYNGKLSSCKSLALAYKDLSVKGNPEEAAANVFETLRWSEGVEGAIRVYFPEIEVAEEEEEALSLAIKDRLTRAASGVVVDTLI